MAQVGVRAQGHRAAGGEVGSLTHVTRRSHGHHVTCIPSPLGSQSYEAPEENPEVRTMEEGLRREGETDGQVLGFLGRLLSEGPAPTRALRVTAERPWSRKVKGPGPRSLPLLFPLLPSPFLSFPSEAKPCDVVNPPLAVSSRKGRVSGSRGSCPQERAAPELGQCSVP